MMAAPLRLPACARRIFYGLSVFFRCYSVFRLYCPAILSPTACLFLRLSVCPVYSPLPAPPSCLRYASVLAADIFSPASAPCLPASHTAPRTSARIVPVPAGWCIESVICALAGCQQSLMGHHSRLFPLFPSYRCSQKRPHWTGGGRSAAPSSPLASPSDHLHDHFLALHINIGCGLVKNVNRRIMKQRPGQSQPLTLSSGEIAAPLRHLRQKPFPGFKELPTNSPLCSAVLQRFFRGQRGRHAQILLHRPLEQITVVV